MQLTNQNRDRDIFMPRPTNVAAQQKLDVSVARQNAEREERKQMEKRERDRLAAGAAVDELDAERPAVHEEEIKVTVHEAESVGLLKAIADMFSSESQQDDLIAVDADTDEEEEKKLTFSQRLFFNYDVSDFSTNAPYRGLSDQSKLA